MSGLKVVFVFVMAAGFSLQPAAGFAEEGRSAISEDQGPLQLAQAAAAPASAIGPAQISLDFNEADIHIVLQALARKAGVNIVASKEVKGTVTIHLENVSWEQALETISTTAGFGFEKNENVVLVATLVELKTRREAMKELGQVESSITKVIELRYLDASDVQAFLEPQLSAQGRISVLEMTGQKGWSFGAAQAGKSSSAEKERGREKRENSRSKAIVITDTPTTIGRVEKILTKIDVLPKQILIETRIMEVSRDLLRDINLGVVTGATAGSTSLTMRTQAGAKQGGTNVTEIAGSLAQTDFTPSSFVPATTGLTAAIAGAQFFFQQLHGMQLSALLKLLEEDVRTNTLSAPNVLTLSGQEARILVGEKYPILKTEVTGTSSTTTTQSLDYYQNIGIELYVVPQVSGDDHISMIVHPVVSSRNGTIGTNAYPILTTRETETQVVLGNGDTVVIGGLLKDVKSKSRIGLPFLGKLPIVGPIFSRTTEDVGKIELLIFITAKLVEPGMLSPDEMARLQQQYEAFMHERLSSRKAKREIPQVPESLEGEAAAPTTDGNRGFLLRKRSS